MGDVLGIPNENEKVDLPKLRRWCPPKFRRTDRDLRRRFPTCPRPVGDRLNTESTMTKRTIHRTALLSVILMICVAACGGGSDQSARAGDGNRTSTSTDGPAEAFPVNIEHKFGTTTIEAEPERVVSVGYIDQDFLLSLGVVPVGIRDWYGDQPFATWPWAQDALGDVEPAVLGSAELNFEAIAALQPDLIVGISSGMTEGDYATLSQIAPTLAQSGDYVEYGTPWRDAFQTVGQAVGQGEAAAGQIEEIDTRLTSVRADHPEFEGKEVALGFALSESEIGAYASQDLRARLMSDLGFITPPEFDELAGDRFYASFSLEQMKRLDRDLLVWIADSDETYERIEASPLRGQLDVVTEGREVFLDPVAAAAGSFSSPLSLPYFLDEVVPQLAEAIGGEPATPTPSE